MATKTLLDDEPDGLLTRCFDAAIVNGFANHPDIRPFIGLPEMGDLDLSPLIEVDDNIFLMGEHGGFAGLWRAPDVYEVHSFIMPAGRGLWAVRAGREAVSYADSIGARMLWTAVPVDRPEAATFARLTGYRPTGQIVPVAGEPHYVYKMGGF